MLVRHQKPINQLEACMLSFLSTNEFFPNLTSKYHRFKSNKNISLSSPNTFCLLFSKKSEHSFVISNDFQLQTCCYTVTVLKKSFNG